MSFSSNDSDILNYRPEINFVEPEFVGEVPLTPEPIETLTTIQDKWNDLDKMAKAGKLLAEALQTRIDDKVRGFYISLDSKVDRAVIDALQRKFPNADPSRITYEQYKGCREAMRDKGGALASELSPDWDKIKEIRSNSDQSQLDFFDINSPGALDGTAFRPDLQDKGQVIEPIDPDEFQDILIKKLMNLLWSKFIKPVVSAVIPPPSP